MLDTCHDSIPVDVGVNSDPFIIVLMRPAAAQAKPPGQNAKPQIPGPFGRYRPITEGLAAGRIRWFEVIILFVRICSDSPPVTRSRKRIDREALF